MDKEESLRVAYVVKRYPRFSETFIVNEILAHEAAGWEIEIFSLLAPEDTHFQDTLARVRAPVHYLHADSLKAVDFWESLAEASELIPDLWEKLERARDQEARDVCQAAMLAQAVRERAIQHIHCHFGTSATSVGRLASQFAEVPYTFTAHAKDIFHEDVEKEKLMRKIADSSAVITVSNFNLQYMRDEYLADPSKLFCIHNGLDLDRFPYESPLHRPPKIAAVGRLIEKKGFATLIEASSLLRERGTRFHCVIIGTGELAETLQALIARFRLNSIVELKGPQPQFEVIRQVQDAAVLAAPCVIGSDGNRDGLPTVLLEAMALGTPCISTDVTGIPEVIIQERTGLLTPQGDAPALADALDRMLKDADLRVRLADEARRLVETEFDVHRNSAALRSLFLSVHQFSRREQVVR